MEADACKVCMGDHNRELHQAVLRIHSWLRSRLLLVLTPIKRSQPLSTVHGLLNVRTLRRQKRSHRHLE